MKIPGVGNRSRNGGRIPPKGIVFRPHPETEAFCHRQKKSHSFREWQTAERGATNTMKFSTITLGRGCQAGFVDN
jgi:hypothetical protein